MPLATCINQAIAVLREIRCLNLKEWLRAKIALVSVRFDATVWLQSLAFQPVLDPGLHLARLAHSQQGFHDYRFLVREYAYYNLFTTIYAYIYMIVSVGTALVVIS